MPIRTDLHFDGVFANASLFHVPSQALPRVLAQLHATLKPGGVLFSASPRQNCVCSY
jgi:SAM-dependent methyltransferase